MIVIIKKRRQQTIMKWTNRNFPQNRPCIFIIICVCGKAELRWLFNLLFFSFYTRDEMQGCDYLFLVSPAFLIHNMAVGMLAIFTPIFMCRRRRCSTSSSSRLSTHKGRERWHASSHLKIHVCWWMITIHILLCSVDLQDRKNTPHSFSKPKYTNRLLLFYIWLLHPMSVRKAWRTN